MHRLCYLSVLMLLFLVGLGATPTEASERICQPDRPLVRLLIRMNLLAHSERELSDLEIRMLSLRLRELKTSHELSEVRVAGRSEVDQPVTALMDVISSILDGGRIDDLHNLTTATTNVTMMLRNICGSGRGDSRKDGYAALEGEGEPGLSLERKPKKTVRNTFTLFFALLAVITVLYLLRFAVLALFSFVFRRMACRVSATAAMGLDLFDGHVMVLGRRGCSFIPADADACERMSDLAEENDCILIFGVIEIGGEIQEIGPTTVAIQFDKTLARSVQDQILSASKSSPRHVRRNRKASEAAIWRRNLEDRRFPLHAMRRPTTDS